MPQQGSPLLDQYNQDGIVTPALQRALDAVKQKLPQFQGLPGAPSQDATPRLQPPGAPVPPITRGPATATPATVATPPAAPAPTITAPDPNATRDLDERNRLISTGSGVSQVKNPVSRGLLRAADIAGTAFFPNITAQIPGTELHHNVLVKRAEGAVNQDVNRAKENAGTAETEARTAAIPGEEALRTAQTAEATARAKTLENPNDKAEAKTLETDQGIMQWNPKTQRYDIPVGQAPGKQTENTHVLPDGTVIAVHSDPKTGKSAAEVLYEGKPTEKPGHVIVREIGGKLHNILVDAETGADRKDLGETRQPNANANDHGTTGFAGGKVVRLEPGQDVPTDFTTATQAGANNAGEAKNIKGADSAVKYGQDYIKSGKFTGPGDEALLEAFFEVAKPSSGFRMSQPQIDMLMNARSWMESAKGIAYHAQNGVWFPPNQRQQIVDTMQARAASKGAGGEAKTPTITSQKEFDALPKGAEYMEDGKKYKKP